MSRAPACDPDAKGEVPGNPPPDQGSAGGGPRDSRQTQILDKEGEPQTSCRDTEPRRQVIRDTDQNQQSVEKRPWRVEMELGQSLSSAQPRLLFEPGDQEDHDEDDHQSGPHSS